MIHNMDIWDKEKRSEVMSLVRNKETKPEILVRKFLFSQGFRYRKNYKKLPGKPDIALPKYKTVIFIHGCFWHGHKLDGQTWHRRIPETNKDFWVDKIHRNEERDKQITAELKSLGWQVITIWECDLSNACKRESTLEALVSSIKSSGL